MAAWVQILLVLFMAARTSAGEIAGERAVIDSERLSGVRLFSVLLARLAFLLPLLLAQSLVLVLSLEMTLGGLPGPAWIRLAMLPLTAVAFGCLCLAISAHTATADRAKSLSLHLVFAQVLLGGALLGFPRVLGSVIHPFITAYYGWSAIIDGMVDNPVFQPVATWVRTWFASPALAVPALLTHAVVGVFLAYLGLRRRRTL